MQSIPLIDKVIAWITRKTPRLNNIINKALEEAYDLGYRDGMMNNRNRLLTKGIKFKYQNAINNKRYLA
tara:strand:- start:4324 stop:4530 length:207 start_codon:yes stop_codon:yes gene_type:complete